MYQDIYGKTIDLLIPDQKYTFRQIQPEDIRQKDRGLDWKWPHHTEELYIKDDDTNIILNGLIATCLFRVAILDESKSTVAILATGESAKYLFILKPKTMYEIRIISLQNNIAPFTFALSGLVIEPRGKYII